jgi:hypothetical protein
MKKALVKAMFMAGLTASLGLGLTSTAQASQPTTDKLNASNHLQLAYHGSNCRWVPGHWYRGYWYPGKKVCYGYSDRGRCVWIPGHWYRGSWIPGHRNCW